MNAAASQRTPTYNGLTPRQRDIVSRLLVGESTAQIAELTGLSPFTVRNHLKGVFDKYGVRSVREVILAEIGTAGITDAMIVATAKVLFNAFDGYGLKWDDIPETPRKHQDESDSHAAAFCVLCQTRGQMAYKQIARKALRVALGVRS